jgi:hypothetical protein
LQHERFRAVHVDLDEVDLHDRGSVALSALRIGAGAAVGSKRAARRRCRCRGICHYHQVRNTVGQREGFGSQPAPKTVRRTLYSPDSVPASRSSPMQLAVRGKSNQAMRIPGSANDAQLRTSTGAAQRHHARLFAARQGAGPTTGTYSPQSLSDARLLHIVAIGRLVVSPCACGLYIIETCHSNGTTISSRVRPNRYRFGGHSWPPVHHAARKSTSAPCGLG